MWKKCSTHLMKNEKSPEEMAEATTTGKKKLGNIIFKGLEFSDWTAPRKDEISTNPINLFGLDSSFVILFASLLVSKDQFSLTHFDDNRFTLGSHNPQNVILNEKKTINDRGDIENTYSLIYAHPRNFLSNTSFAFYNLFEDELTKLFCRDVGFDFAFSEKKWNRL